MKLLLAEDETELARAVMTILQLRGYAVDTASDGAQALQLANDGVYDGLILDIMMPQIDGIAVLQELRAHGDMTPVLMLTAKSTTDDKVVGLEQGANDYLTKPFESKELIARIQAMLRSREQLAPAEIIASDFRMNRERQSLEGQTGSVSLNLQEFRLLEQFTHHAERLFTKAQLLEKVWSAQKDEAVVSVYVSYLNHKLASIQAQSRISETIDGLYRLEMGK